MDNPQATDIELGWLAGIIDGEGWLGMVVDHQHKREINGQPALKIRVELKITNCDEAIVERSADILKKIGLANPYRRTHKSLGEDRRRVHEVATKHMTSLHTVLVPMAPLLTGNKRERADIMLRFIESRKTNPGYQRTDYPEKGRFGARTLFPYTPDELDMLRACRDLQCRGASETTRATREKMLQRLIDQYASYQERYPLKGW